MMNLSSALINVVKLTLSVVIILTPAIAEALHEWEIVINNGSTGSRTFKMENVSGKCCWDKDLNVDITGFLDGGEVTVSGLGTTGWNFHGAGGDLAQNVGHGLYKISRDANNWFFIDFTSDEILESDTTSNWAFDAVFEWNDAADAFFCATSEYDCNNTEIVNGSTVKVWEETAITELRDGFQPLDPSGLSVNGSGGSPSYPVITWSSSAPPYADATIGGSKHDVWRRKGSSGSYTKIKDNHIPLSYTDNDVFVGSGSVFYYKVRGRNSDDTKYSPAYSNVDNISGSFGGEKIASGGGNNPRYSEFRVSNYPNPFNPETSITFELPAASEIKLVVYNILGKEVAKLASGHYAAGKHTIKWDGSRSASGLYYYTLITDDEVAIGKMSLTK